MARCSGHTGAGVRRGCRVPNALRSRRPTNTVVSYLVGMDGATRCGRGTRRLDPLTGTLSANSPACSPASCDRNVRMSGGSPGASDAATDRRARRDTHPGRGGRTPSACRPAAGSGSWRQTCCFAMLGRLATSAPTRLVRLLATRARGGAGAATAPADGNRLGAPEENARTDAPSASGAPASVASPM
jgi:hypothetical protein